MADKSVPSSLVGRIRQYVGREVPETKIRAIILSAGGKAITLDSYHDPQIDAAADWLSQYGWDMASAVASALTTPLVRVTVHKRMGRTV